MLEEQDSIQAFAKSYADRFTAEAFLEVIQENTGKTPDPVDQTRIGQEPLVMTVDQVCKLTIPNFPSFLILNFQSFLL